MLKETNTPTRPRIEPGSPDPESDALTIRPVRPPFNDIVISSVFVINNIHDPYLFDVFPVDESLVDTNIVNMSLVLRKPVFGVSDQVRHKPGCTATEDG